ncbi:MFS transporter [Nocardia terpenica]|uniref:MFS transporter n=1 Tax=Nocardia terpenica TaxID=455432 RepID=A0A291RIK6_9NOCA|nr:MFS transporter [Nocardia terpenica]ATL67433.1 MFS transporter [Nocardia terpenica]
MAAPSAIDRTSTPGRVLATAALGVVLPNLDLFIVNVALPSIASGMHTPDVGELSWILNAYTIVFAALLVPAGRMADRTSRRTGFLLGVAVFIAASAACALSVSVPMLVGFRALQAVGAAMLVPTSLSLVLAAYEPERRAGAVRVWASTASAAAAISPVIAGPLVLLSWRWVFLINLPIGIVVLLMGWRLLPDVEGRREPRPDAAGAGLLIVGIAALTLALVRGGDWGWSSDRVLGLFVATVAAMAAFAWRSARHPSPVLEIGLLRSRSFALATLSTFLFAAALGAYLLSGVLWVQNVWHWSALRSGLAIAPGPALVPLWSIVAGKLMPRIGARPVVIAGCLAFAAALAWWVLAMRVQPNYLAGMLGGAALTGVGVGLTVPTLFGMATAALPPDRFATGSGAVNMIRQLGIAVGVAVLVAVIGTPAANAGALHAFRHGWLVVAAISVACALTGLLLRRPGRTTETGPAAASPSGGRAR